MLSGGVGRDALINVGPLVGGAFVGVSGIEIVRAAGNISLGADAAAAGVDTLQLSQAGASTATLTGFNAALTVTGSALADSVVLSLADAGNKTLNLGTGGDQVTVNGVAGAAAGSVIMSFVSGDVGNGTGRVTIDGPNGDVTAGNTNIRFIGNQANQFSVIGTDAAGVLIPAQDRGDFQTVVLGSAGADTLATGAAGNLGNVYINAGGGDDVLTSTAGTGQRHFLVGGAGNDTFNVNNGAGNDGTTVIIAGGGDDTVTVDSADGQAEITLVSGTNTVTFIQGLELNTAAPAVNTINDNRDILVGGSGIDTLVATNNQLTGVAAPVTEADRSISGFEELVFSDAFDDDLTTSNIQANILTVTLRAGIDAGGGSETLTFDGGAARTLNLASQLANAAGSNINVVSAGTGTTDQITIANTAAAVGGASVNVFNGRSITATGTEVLVLNGSGNGTATAQTIGNFTGAGLNFVGSNSFATTPAAAALNATGAISAAGLTGAASLSAVIAGATSVTGSANGDSISIAGTVAAAVNTGAGNDTVTLSSLNGPANSINGTLNGGEGAADTLRASVTNAAAFSTANGTSSKVSGFEQLSILDEVSGSTNFIRLDNLGTTTRVISDGIVAGIAAPTIGAVTVTQGVTPVTGVAEAVTVAGLNGLGAGETLTLTVGAVTRTVTASAGSPGTASVQRFSVDSISDSVTSGDGIERYSFTLAGRSIEFRLSSGDSLTTQEVAAAFASGVSDLTGSTQWTIGGTLTTGYTVTADNGVLVFTNANPGQQTQLAVIGFTTNDATNNQTPAYISTGSTLGTNAIPGGLTAANLATVLASGMAGMTGATVGGVGTFPFNAGVVTGNSVSFTATNPGVLADATVAVSAGVAPTVTVNTQGVTAVTGVAETAQFTFVDLTEGQSITFGGRTVTAESGPVTAAVLAAAFNANTSQNGVAVSGTLASGFTSGVAGAVVTLTGPQSNVTDLTAAALGVNGEIILQNLANNGTLELTGAGNNGTHTVEVTASGLNTADVFNLALSGATSLNYGNVGVANVERINIQSNGTAGQVDTVVLNATSADTIAITGNKGLNLTGNLGAVKTLDASGVTAGGVTFAAQATTVTLIGGAGDDVLTGSAGNDRIEANAGNDLINAGAGNDTIVLGLGSDTVILGVNLATNGLDTISGFTAGDSNGATAGLGNGDRLDIGVGVDSNGAAAGLSFNTATAAAGVDLSIDSIGGNNSSLFVVVDGQATLNLTNVKAATNNTAASGEILVADDASQYVLHAASDASNTANLYRVYDSAAGAAITAAVELIGTVSLTNTVGDFVTGNFI